MENMMSNSVDITKAEAKRLIEAGAAVTATYIDSRRSGEAAWRGNEMVSASPTFLKYAGGGGALFGTPAGATVIWRTTEPDEGVLQRLDSQERDIAARDAAYQEYEAATAAWKESREGRDYEAWFDCPEHDAMEQTWKRYSWAQRKIERHEV